MNVLPLFPKHPLFLAQTTAALTGAYLTNYYEAVSHLYWLLMLLLMAVLTIAPYYAVLSAAKKTFYTAIQYWAGSVCAAGIVYALHHAGRIDIHETGLIILLILALSTYFEGVVNASKRKVFVGFYLGLIVLSTAFPDTYLWQLFLLAVLAMAYSHYRQGIKPLNSRLPLSSAELNRS